MFAKTLLLLGLTAVATSFTIPEGTPDGFYRAYLDESGHEIHEPVSPGALDPASNPPVWGFASSKRAAHLDKRGTVWCGCGFGMDHGDCDAANNDLKNQLGAGATIGPRLSYYSKRGSAVAFMCNFDGTYSARANSGDVTIGAEHVTQSCGWYIAGTWRVDGQRQLDYGYMNGPNVDFCGNAEGSGAHHC